jgi:hypothetical protein
MSFVKRKVFISYHHADQIEVDTFIRTFSSIGQTFLYRGLGVEMADDIINSNNTDYVMRKIRERYIQDSTVTIGTSEIN